MRIAIDTGGTFTDCVCLEDGKLRVKKIFSSPADPSRAVLDGVRQLGGTDNVEVRHGTTVGTNTMLERTGARVAFVTTAGFEDTIAIGRQARARLYDWFAPVPVCLVPKELRFGVAERVSAEGEILREPTDDELARLAEAVRASGAEAVAISLLFSFANPKTERRVEAALRKLGIPISVSHRILPEFREYERASTTVVNAYLAPRMAQYLTALEERVAVEHKGGRVDVMQSSGGIIAARVAAEEPVRTVLSGPAGGVVGACRMAQWAGFDKIIGFDMGGTSTDVFVASAATGAERTHESVIAGVPISVPMLDIHTAGAGGGSLARFDAGGMLRIGPESAGADPGPICFGRGVRATVTDANFVLGRLDAESFLGGGVHLDGERARRLMREQVGALATVEDFAAGIVRVVETQMEKAIRVISVERGLDPRDFTLVAFGGGGPLHACSLARALRIPRVLVPALPGALSAVGILLADTVRDFSRTVMLPGEAPRSVSDIFRELEMQGTAEFAAEGLDGAVERSVDLRYRGQGYELNVGYDPAAPERSMAAFHELHRQRYGFADAARPVEIVNLRVRMIAASEPYEPERLAPVAGRGNAAHTSKRDVWFEGGCRPTRIYKRELLRPGDAIAGPAMITEYTAATLLPPGCVAQVDGLANLVIDIGEVDGVHGESPGVEARLKTKSADPVELAIFQSAVHSIAEEMGAALRRTALSPNIKERRDYSCAVFDGRGRAIAMGDHMPVHLGSMPMSVQAAIAAIDFAPGDIAILNDPYAGGTHLPDITMVLPVFLEGHAAPVFYVANRAHHADVGGKFAGSMGPATTIEDEGIRISPVRIVRGGALDRDVLDWILRSVRTPEERKGDLDAQMGACRVGEQRVLELAAKYGMGKLTAWSEELLDYSERLVRAELKKMPSGIFDAEDWLDDDGVNDNPIRIAVRLRIDPAIGEIDVDFAGSSGQVAGAVNAVRAITLSACFYVLRCLLPEDAPATEGIVRPLTLHAPEGSIVNARPPAAVAGGNVETSQRIVDVLMCALAKAVPERVPAASAGTMSNVTIGGMDSRTGDAFAYYETAAGGMGARPGMDGISGVHTHMTNSLNTPVEALEYAYPFRVRRYGYRYGSAGEGKFRGGDGLIREVELLADAEVTLLADRRKFRPYGLEGGNDGALGRALVLKGAGGEEIELPGKCSRQFKKGHVLRIETPGGGGWGKPVDGGR